MESIIATVFSISMTNLDMAPFLYLKTSKKMVVEGGGINGGTIYPTGGPADTSEPTLT